jgi:hypothetical protein
MARRPARTPAQQADAARAGVPALLSACLDTTSVPGPKGRSLSERSLFVYTARTSLRGVEELTWELHESGHDVAPLSSSEADRQFIDLGEKLLGHMSSRPLDRLNLAAIVVDGTVVGKHTVAWALGVAMDGTKVPLGIAEGKTENTEVYRTLLRSLRDRNLDLRDVLWVVDGGDPVLNAVREVAGPDPLLQRCIVHKVRKLFKSHLSVEDCTDIGRRLVADHTAAPDVEPERVSYRPHLRLDKEMLELVAQAPDDKATLRTIGERMIRRELYVAWGRADEVLAREGLLGVAAWLEQWGHGGAANSLRGDLDDTLTLQRLGLFDKKMRRLMQTTNMIESPHEFVKELKTRSRVWMHVTQRLRFVAVALARAEKAFHPVAERAQVEQLSLRALARRHRDVLIRIEPGARPDTLRVDQLMGFDGVDVELALADLVDWADRNGSELVVPDRVVAGTPEPAAARQWLVEHGFSEAAGRLAALVRAPDPGGRLVPIDGRAATPAAALSRIGSAVGGDNRLVMGIAQAALRMTPELAEDGVDLHAEAARLGDACRDLATLRNDVARWGQDYLEDAAKQGAGEATLAIRDGRDVPDVLAGGRDWVLQPEQADRLKGRVVVRATEIRDFDRAHVERLMQRPELVEPPLAKLDVLVARTTAAARAVAAVYVLDGRRQIEAASVRAKAPRRRVKDAAVESSADAGAQVPRTVSDARSVLGGRAAEALEAYSEALSRDVGALDDAALAELRTSLAGTGAVLRTKDAAETVELEEKGRPATLQRFRRAVEQHTCSEGKTADHARRVAGRAWRDLRKIDTKLDTLNARMGSRDRFLLERPEFALEDAAEIEWSGRHPELAVDPVQVTPVHVDIAVPAVDLGPAL